MIYTCTITPSLDYTTYLPKFKVGELNRSEDVHYYPGGKGINVSRVLKRLDIDSVAIGFAGGFVGDYIQTFLHEEAIQTDFIETTDITRINVKIKAEVESELNGPGPAISTGQQRILVDKVRAMKEGDWFVLAGSLPETISTLVFEELAAICEKNKVHFVLDTSGPALKKLIRTKPFLMKPNAAELGELFDTQITTKQEALHYAKACGTWRSACRRVDGRGRSTLVTKELALAAESPKGQAVNTVGAGDSLVAGFIASYVQNGNATEAFRYGVASGSATAFRSDLCEKVGVEALTNEVKIIPEEDVRR